MSASRTIRSSFLLRLGGTRWTDRQGGYTAGGESWEFTGRVFSVSDITLATIRGSSPMSFTIRDDDAGTWRTAAKNNSLLADDVEFWLLENDDPPVLAFKGSVVEVLIDRHMVTIKAGSFLLGLDTVRYLDTSPESQKQIDPADTCYDRLAGRVGNQNARLIWKSDV